jgi:hypothetical protein
MTLVYQEEGFMGSGEIYIDAFDPLTGLKTGELDVGNALIFALNAPSIEKKEQKGMRRENYGQTIKSVITKIEQEFKITLTDINRENLRLIMYGAGSDLTQATGSGSETVTAIKGRWVKLSNRNLSKTTPPVVTVASVAQTEGEDYEIDYQVGRIYVLPGGGITAGASMTVESTWLALSGYKVAANKVNKIEAFIRFVGYDNASERDCEVVIYKGQLEPAGDINWLTEDLASLELKGKVLATPEGTWDVIVY